MPTGAADQAILAPIAQQGDHATAAQLPPFEVQTLAAAMAQPPQALYATSAGLAAARVRQATTPLVLPLAEAVPSGVLYAPHGNASDWTVLRTLASAATLAARGQDWTGLSALARGALLHLPAVPAALLARPPLDLRCSADPHDAFFRIVRSQERVAPAYLRGLVQALLFFIEESQLPETRRAYAGMGQALAGLWAAALGAEAGPPASRLPSRPEEDAAPVPVPARWPMQRWLRGQQLFAVLAQGLIWTLQTLPQHLEADDRDAVGACLRRAARLHQASAQALAFMVDFHPRHLADTLRPAMRVPHVPAGFRGSLSADHRHVMALRMHLAPALRAAQALCPDDHARLGRALAAAQVSHRSLWRRLVSDDAPLA